MKSIYVTSVERYSGKTAVCLGLGKKLQIDGYKVGYLKPLSLQPWMVGGKLADEDAGFVKEVMGLSAQPWELSPVVITPDILHQHLISQSETNFMNQVRTACEASGAGQDVLLLEGGGSLREGYAVGLPTPAVVSTLGSFVLLIVQYHDDVGLIDDVLAAKARLEDSLGGVLINRVTPQANPFITQTVMPFFENRGIPVYGALPDLRALSALTVEEISRVLDADVLTKYYRPQAIVESLTVGAMTAETALSRFRKHSHKAVITGGDRTDIQLAALETSTTCLILTGDLHPSPLVVKQAEEFGVAVLLVRPNTMEAIERIESIYGKTRLAQTAKLRQFEALLDEHFNFQRLYSELGFV